MINYKFSIIIRTYNEEKRIGEVLEAISKQNYKNYEIIIVDSESTDNTVNICKKYNTKIITIKKESFNYSYASNIGAENATGDILCYISGYSIPVNDDYLLKANIDFNNSVVGGVYGEVIALPDGSVVEKVFNRIGYMKSIKEGKKLESSIHPGILSCSNAFIRKELWNKYRFKDELGFGGEDVEMAYRIIQGGKSILKDPELLVMHSHGKGLIKFIDEFKGWRNMYSRVLDYIEKN